MGDDARAADSLPVPFGEVSATDAALRERLASVLHIDDPEPGIPIGLVGCGWIGGLQLETYRRLGLEVVAIADRHLDRAGAHALSWFPDAAVYSDIDSLVAHPGLAVVDVATHLEGRSATIRAAIAAGKHVLSQKPFVDDLEEGRLLALEAEAAGTLLAVNQNGRWAPHFAAMLAVAGSGLIGDVVSADFAVAWPHDLVVADKPAFASMDDLILFDFGAHWFDLLGLLAPAGPIEVRAVTGRRDGQRVSAPTQADAVLTGEDFVGTVSFRAAERFREHGGYRISGTEGVITQSGLSLGGRLVTVDTAAGTATIATDDDWFASGLAGPMRELLAAVRDSRAPSNDAASALRGLELCFAALESARTGAAVISGSVTTRHP